MSGTRWIMERYEGGVLGWPEDGRAIGLTNSETGKAACLLRWWFGEVEGLKSPATNAMEFGSAWDKISEDIYRWWMVKGTPYPDEGLHRCAWCETGWIVGAGEKPLPCATCGSTRLGSLDRGMLNLRARVESDPPSLTEEEYEHEREKMHRIAVGYLLKHEHGFMQEHEIVGVQVALARPICRPNGAPWTPETFLRVLPDGSREIAGTRAIALHGEAIRSVRWPWYQVGRLDAIARNRQTRAGWVVDAKCSADPGRYRRSLAVDPQLPGYCWLLDEHREKFGITEVVGFLYDVVNSAFQHDPKVLVWKPPLMEELRRMAEERGVKPAGKKAEDYCAALGIVPGHGGFSVAENVNVPSWRFEWAIEDAGIAPEPYANHIEGLRDRVDAKLFDRPWQSFGSDDVARWRRQVWSEARRLSEVRRALVRAETREDVELILPRTPVCLIAGGSCGHKAPCANDTAEARGGYEIRPSQRWTVLAPGTGGQEPLPLAGEATGGEPAPSAGGEDADGSVDFEW